MSSHDVAASAHLAPCRFAPSRAQIYSIDSASGAALIFRIAAGE